MANLLTLERVNASYLQRLLGLPKNAPTRLAYSLAGCGYLVEQLAASYMLEATTAYTDYMNEVSQKKNEISPLFYQTPTMTQNWWR